MWAYNYSASLEHHGIPGMKWGVRRFQNADGSLTSAGRRRYNVNVDAAKARVRIAKKEERSAKTEYNKATLYGIGVNKKATEKYVKAVGKTDWEKEKLRSEKAKNGLNEDTKAKSKHRSALEEEYKKKGMSSEEAEIAAYKREKTEKILAVTAGVAITAAAAYVAYKHYDKTVDRIIKAGTELQNMSTNSNKGVADAFYASMTKMDNTKYRGLYGKQLGAMGNRVYETKIGVDKELRVASEKSAVNALRDLVSNDSSYAKELKDRLLSSVGQYPSDEQNNVINRGLAALNKGTINGDVYNALNISLTDHSLPQSTVDKFYEVLKKKGYDAITDVNDKKYSGYMSSKPTIVFNGGPKLSVKNVREVGGEEIAKDAVKGMADITVKSLIGTLATGVAGAGATTAVSRTMKNKNRDAIVNQYKKEHPETKLTYNEILDNYYGKR